ncbi:16S rRNA (cytosine(1402)-N(4))-methyltransferase RsmH [Flavobacteriaceae bacterium]|nr:16S rRNA (cytosine(1402)-N(4))-methyltransferase RsmH [Flavobacteriaceae bacterium]MDB9712412.1 16S rRNA (cytosine(1402)-N(4))-methyltransferase RsmH [Flavobacteriaceae bacterium]MDC1493107.1 16S rRNA (cytosine(1402)-N(4))-methyltransferase RsmH [Flavobacteriaceae bacterium]
MIYHNPVLLNESVEGLNIIKDGIYVDVTFGGGGHSQEILKKLGRDGRLIAFDQDLDALDNKINDKRFLLINKNFMYLKENLLSNKIDKVDGILADFGISSHQIDVPKRGFSLRYDANLDMRMDQNSNVTAFDIINNYSFEQLSKIFYDYGELRMARLISRKIIDSRLISEIKTTLELNNLLIDILPKKRSNKLLAQIYQALRIEVNSEIDVIKSFLIQTQDVLKEKGRLSIISYHSLEDRLVKRFIRSGLFHGDAKKDIYGNEKLPFKKIGKLIIPTEKEINRNNRARSAKLRIAERN